MRSSILSIGEYPISVQPLLFVILLLFLSTVDAQNLVPNPGFEEYLDPPPYTAAGVNESVAWFNLGRSTDFFHRSFRNWFSVPLNFRGNQEAASGDGYAGIFSWPVTIQEHLAVKLVSPLETGVIYEVGFKVNLSNRSKYATDNLGLAFLQQDPRALEVPIQEATPYHFKNPDGEMISDTVGWKDLRGSYLARGGENYLVIGNFRGEGQIPLQISNTSQDASDRVYFYIDDVFVQTCEDQTIEPAAAVDTLICTGVSIVLKGLPEADTYYWEGLDVSQDLAVDKAGAYLVHNFSRCSDVQLLYQVETADCDCSIQIPSVQESRWPLRILSSLNVQSWRLRFFDAAGRLLFRTTEAEVGDLQLPLPSAMYFWQAELVCLDVNDLSFSKRMSGKTAIVNR